MKRIFSKTALFLLLAGVILSGCNKKTPEPDMAGVYPDKSMTLPLKTTTETVTELSTSPKTLPDTVLSFYDKSSKDEESGYIVETEISDETETSNDIENSVGEENSIRDEITTAAEISSSEEISDEPVTTTAVTTISTTPVPTTTKIQTTQTTFDDEKPYLTLFESGYAIEFYGNYKTLKIIAIREDEIVYYYGDDNYYGVSSALKDGNDNNKIYAFEWGNLPKMSDDSFEKTVFEMTNRFRAKNDLIALEYNEQLKIAAKNHSKDMYQRSFFSHINPDGKAPKDRMISAGYFTAQNWRAYAENIIYNYRTPSSAFHAWVNSSGHRVNLLATACDELGVGFYTSPGGEVFGTQNFGKK